MMRKESKGSEGKEDEVYRIVTVSGQNTEG